ncbi:FliI/YscN family ATPase [Notoacmeibacter sp. MSK16QG-6]|uniref:FliI/YscN family ATPase n=1 Tax=Notoacmeibacter sp. MSK16QG-6 TaxID=2957982 RepID=UPI0020A06B1B|nr:FliI/YscN family ATPase [Notoacmeibacter sp. MSK16QG-6]MCP1200911.1 FliI/YscN family ATPase [Notoacmeibacter sp. MSK16QG-6]
MTGQSRLQALAAFAADAAPITREAGRVVAIASGQLRLRGLGKSVSLGECLICQTQDGPVPLQVVRIDNADIRAAPFHDGYRIRRDDIVLRIPPQTGRPAESWKGRVLDGLGTAIDGQSIIVPETATAPAAHVPRHQQRILSACRVDEAFRTGVAAIDVFTPLCYGQRLGIFAGSGVGKSTLLSMLANSGAFDVVVIGLIGERTREAREFMHETLGEEARKKAITIVATSDETALMRARAAELTMTTAEWYRDQGKRVLVLFDSVTRYAHALREVGIALGEAPIARGYPPSVFAALPKLMERGGPALDGNGGSITMIATVLVDGDEHNEPIGDTLRGILDGHVVLSRAIAAEGRYPPVDVTQSLSRLALRAWTDEHRLFVSELRALIARYEETQDLRLLGGWRPGADPFLDKAVQMVPVIYDTIRQSPGDTGPNDPFDLIARRLKAVSAVKTEDPQNVFSTAKGQSASAFGASSALMAG